MRPLSTVGSLGDEEVSRGRAKKARRILIVEDDKAMACWLRGIAASFGTVAVEATVSGALNRVVGHPLWSAFIVDTLQDGCGLDVVSCARADNPYAAILILAAHIEHRSLHAAFDLRAQYLDKLATRAQIETFFASAMLRPGNCNLPPSEAPPMVAGPSGLIEEKLARLAESYNLTTTDVEVVRACLHGYSGKEYTASEDLSVNTYKRRVRRALRKLGASSVGEVRDRLLRVL